ncbi:MAG TPA: sulfotransferase, partial [Steroidobacteraceae bacterium]|nr:sulfotransferase [Steroidobacteraceae bacterium]
MSTPQASPFGERLRQAEAALRAGHAVGAERALRALVAERPGEPDCLWLLGTAVLDQGKIAESIALFEGVLERAADYAEARVDLARAYRRAGRTAEARTEVRRVLEATPHHHRGWLAYGDVLVDLGQYEDARVAFDRARLTDPQRPQVEAASTALLRDERRNSEELFRAILRRDASHVGALCGLAALSLVADVPRDAERLLRHALRQSEHLPLAYRGLAPTLMALGRLTEAEAATRYLARIEPQSPQTWVTTAGVAIRLMRPAEAVAAYQRALELRPEEAGLRMSIGHLQKTLGERAESEASYKQALAMDPGRGEGYWSLADLKNYTFSDSEIAALQRVIDSDPRSPSNEAQLHFALGRAFEQRRQYAEAFARYARGAQLRRGEGPFDIVQFERRSARIRAFFNADFFTAHRGSGDPSRAPIFIVGLPRSGSTLVEQILASHSAVEGTMELPNVLNIIHELDAAQPARNAYPEAVGSASSEQLSLLGRRYLEQTAPLLRLERARFTDKLPNNFSHIGLIHAILPRATVIDVRRHPMDACFSAFKQ